MTRREFDAANKWNYGQRMPSDTRESYRDGMHRTGDYVWCPTVGKWRRRPDQLARKAAMGPLVLLRPSPLRTGLSYRLLGRVIHSPSLLRSH